MPPSGRDNDDNEKGSGSGRGALWFLFFLLLLLLLAAGAAAYYWFRVRRDRSLQLHTGSTNALRLLHDDPSEDEFISNNASTDSLPALAQQDIPFLPIAAAEADAAAHGLAHAPPIPSYRDDEHEALDPLGAVRKPMSGSSQGERKPTSGRSTPGTSSGSGSHSRRSSRNWSRPSPPSNNPNTVFSLEDDNPNTVFSLEDDSD
ncbi:hypothetical protein CspeluHIS016_0108220 [Cutaneotrichosporon spelunceum]|uniref:Uncharacterized protein n=1 Tax=Cutaneotrichosporon spelunceum TaxID=1672016 RepID=A0AAD3TNQ5_9TREE|nr:hypothetical protein CspeluHIS016_0108220 [Cutaneotrichosporon spelunceum]